MCLLTSSLATFSRRVTPAMKVSNSEMKRILSSPAPMRKDSLTSAFSLPASVTKCRSSSHCFLRSSACVCRIRLWASSSLRSTPTAKCSHSACNCCTLLAADCALAVASKHAHVSTRSISISRRQCCAWFSASPAVTCATSDLRSLRKSETCSCTSVYRPRSSSAVALWTNACLCKPALRSAAALDSASRTSVSKASTVIFSAALSLSSSNSACARFLSCATRSRSSAAAFLAPLMSLFICSFARFSCRMN
mmetsp:Transcript_54207/g.129156  ORF Transcript_54207/g.129156 Transcript_54207/m.129156 type:complete len:251 (+) Transcript_54207:896-1648(+)